MISLLIFGLAQSSAWQKTSFFPMHTNFAVFMVLFMVCTIEAVIIKIATAANEDMDNSINEECVYLPLGVFPLYSALSQRV